MLQVTRQERLALGVTALLILAGAGARILATDPAAAEWGDPDAAAASFSAEGSTSTLRETASRELERARERAEPLAPGERIDINTASADQIDRLPRVGPELAARIVERRSQVGRYRSLADLDSVSGVGPALLREVEPYLGLPASSPAPRASRASAGLDINRATVAELDALPGIGPVIATRIVDWRKSHGPFRTVDDLGLVPGIGPALLEKLSPSLRARP